jgi:hypothetical protein
VGDGRLNRPLAGFEFVDGRIENWAHGQQMAKSSKSRIKPLMSCPNCKRGEMCLRGIEAESTIRDLFTFECDKCGALEVRGVRVR